MRVLFLCKKDKPYTAEAARFLKKKFGHVDVLQGDRFRPFPAERALASKPDLLVSYLSPWIVPARVLRRTKCWNINFHPGPPQYPGIGCFNFALYNGEKSYGATAHLMARRVDSGKILGVKRFGVRSSEDVRSLSARTYRAMHELFLEVMGTIAKKGTVPASRERWTRRPYKRKQLEALCRVPLSADRKEVLRKVRAAYYPGMPGPYVQLGGVKFEYNPDR